MVSKLKDFLITDLIVNISLDYYKKDRAQPIYFKCTRRCSVK